jgi:general secretion pathway protein C
LADVIRISPQQSDGQLKGYRVSPGRDKKQFEALGLKPNDVVTSINGIELDDPAKAVEVYKIIRSASEATFVIDRKGEVVELVVSLAEG